MTTSGFGLHTKAFLLVVAAAMVGPSRQVAAVTIAENSRAVGNTSGSSTYTLGSGATSAFGAENFTLSSAYNVTSISHVALHNGLQPTSIAWGIYANFAGEPTDGTSLYSGTAASGVYTTATEGSAAVGPGYSIIRYSIALSGITLAPGQGNRMYSC